MYLIELSGDVLELGGGERPHFHPNLDVRNLPEVDIVRDLNEVPYPFEDNTFDGVLGIYVLEHLGWRNIRSVVGEIRRILKPSGKAVFLIPNTYEQCLAIVKRGWNEKSAELLFGGQDYGANAHSCGFSPRYVRELFAGFDVKILTPMPNVYLRQNGRNIPLFPACDTDMVVEAVKH